MGDGPQNLQREHALWGGGVDWVTQGLEMCAAGFLLLATLLFALCLEQLLSHPQELAKAIEQVFAYGAA